MFREKLLGQGGPDGRLVEGRSLLLHDDDAEQLPLRLPAGAAARTWAHESAPVLMGLVPGFVLQRALRPGFDEEAFLRAIGTLLPAD